MTNAERLQELCQKLNSEKDKAEWNRIAKQFEDLNKSAPKDLIPFYNWLRKTS